MSYKKFISYFLFSLVCTIAVFQPALFYLNLDTGCEREEYLAEWIQAKESISQGLPAPKIVLLSGSNTLFGIDAEQMEQKLKIPVLNMGLHAGMGEYVFYAGKSVLHAGDVVILPLEYSYYELATLSGEGVAFVTHYDSSYVQALPYGEQIRLIYNYSFVDMLSDLVSGLRGTAEKKQTIYSAENFDSRGDIRGNDVRGSIMAAPAKYAKVFSDAEVPNAKSRRILEDFLTYCAKNNITVYAAWPSYLTCDRKLDSEDSDRIRQIMDFWSAHNVKMLGDCEENLYDAGMFFDTNYHLNDAGRKIRTEKLLKNMQEESFLSDYFIEK